MYKDICISPKMPLWPFYSELSPIFGKHKYFARKSNKYFSNRKQSGIYFLINIAQPRHSEAMQFHRKPRRIHNRI